MLACWKVTRSPENYIYFTVVKKCEYFDLIEKKGYEDLHKEYITFETL